MLLDGLGKNRGYRKPAIPAPGLAKPPVLLFKQVVPNDAKPVQLFWEGTTFAHHSYSHVNRELCLALLRGGELDLTLMPHERDEFDPLSVPRFAPLIGALARNKSMPPEDARIWVRLQYPLRPMRPPKSAWVIYTTWEYSLLPIPALKIMQQAREVWAQSSFTVAAMVRSGIPAERAHVIPGGVELETFRPDGPRADLPTKKPFRFLFVGGTIFRKGIDLLLQAYAQAFTASDPVSLVIKDFGANHLYRGQTGEDMIREFTQNPAHPEIVHLLDHRTPEELAALYRACDVFVSSYRGEGFSMPTLEAMACGLPVIVTQGGSTDDYVSDACGWRIPSAPRSVGTMIYREPVNGEAFLLEPNVEALTHLLRKASTQHEVRIAKGNAAAKIARDWTWDHAAKKVVARCRSLAAEMRGASS